MDASYKLLTVKEMLWADIIRQMLRENGIPCQVLPLNENHMIGSPMTNPLSAVLGITAGLTGLQKIYVPESDFERARELTELLLTPPDEA